MINPTVTLNFILKCRHEAGQTANLGADRAAQFEQRRKKHNEKGKKHSRLIACQYKWKLITWISEIRSWWFVFQCGINMFE